MADLSKIYLYRMTHIENVPHILLHGITHKDSAHANPAFTPIGDPTLITARNGFVLDNGNALGAYIPFYFGTRMPMLYVIQNGFNGVSATPPEQIVYLVSSTAKIVDAGLDFVFSDGHAVDSFSSQYMKNDVEQIDKILDMDAIKAKYWKSDTDLDLKRRKEAEFLVLGDIPFSAILAFLVYDDRAKSKLQAMAVDESIVHIHPKSYF